MNAPVGSGSNVTQSNVELSKEVKKLRLRFRRVGRRVRQSGKVEDIHQLRIVTRRLRAAIWLSRHSKNGPRLKKLNRRLRDIGRQLGEQRTLEVLISDAKQYGLSDRALRESSKKSRKKVMRLLCRKNRNEMSKLIRNAESQILRVNQRQLQPSISELIARVESLLRLRPRSTAEWHRMRIGIKKLRYASELLCLNSQKIKKLQDCLGRLHDLEVLKSRFGAGNQVKSEMQRLQVVARQEVEQSLAQLEKLLVSRRYS